MTDADLTTIRRVAAALGDLVGDVVFVGGAVIPLLVTDSGAPAARFTEDVDVVVTVSTVREYHGFTAALLRRGFVPDDSEGAPICRFKLRDVVVDVMPTDPVLGFGNPWYRTAVATAISAQAGDMTIRIASAPAWLATKIVAFADRGGGDFQASHDMEDIVTLIDRRPELSDELARADAVLRDFVKDALRNWLGSEDFLDALAGHLHGDEASQARLPALMARIRALAED